MKYIESKKEIKKKGGYDHHVKTCTLMRVLVGGWVGIKAGLKNCLVLSPLLTIIDLLCRLYVILVLFIFSSQSLVI